MHKIHHTIPSVDYMKELSLLQHWENTAIAHPCPWIHVHVYIYVTCRARLRNHKRDFVFLWYISLWVRIPDSHSSSHCFKITNWLAASVLSSNRSVRIGTMLLALSTYSPQKPLTTNKMAGLTPEFRIGAMLFALSTYSPQKPLTTNKMADLIPEFRIGTMLLALSTYSPQKSLTTDKMAGLIPEFRTGTTVSYTHLTLPTMAVV